MATKDCSSPLVFLKTEDNVSIAVRHARRTRDRAVLLAPGFYNNKNSYLFLRIAEMFGPVADAISFDFRGHGQSGGLFTWTARETLDVRCVVKYAREQGYRHIVVAGFSLGAAVALVEASRNRDIHGVISVSAPADVRKIDFRFWEPEMIADMRLNLGMKGRGKCVRPGNPFLKKIAPLSVVTHIAPSPVLFVHGARDWLIRPQHSERLFAQAQEPKQLAIIADAGHAEKIFDDQPATFRDICYRWLTNAASAG